jgi:hypothetical protein
LSGYGGQPPGWQDPYGRPGQDPQGAHTPQGWQDPYSHPGHGYGPPGVPSASGPSGSTIAALICNLVSILVCCNLLAIPGVITSAIAMSRSTTDPGSARTLTRWSWGLFIGSIVITVLLAAVYVILMVTLGNDVSATGTGTSF